MRKNINAFTLIEMLTVVLIISILSTIWFVSFTSYLSSTRDTNRIVQLEEIFKWLSTHITKWKLYKPEDRIDVKYGSGLVWYEWYAWKKVLTSIWYSKEWVDPKDWTYFWYYLTKNRKYFQLLSFLENSLPENLSIYDKSFATNLKSRIPYVKWQKLWILMDKDNILIQDISSIKNDWYIDISNVWNLELKAYLTSTDYLSGTWTTFIPLKKFAEVWWQFCSTTNTWCIAP